MHASERLSEARYLRHELFMCMHQSPRSFSISRELTVPCVEASYSGIATKSESASGKVT